MSAENQNATNVAEKPSEWEDEDIRHMNRHMRIHFRHLSSAVRQMALQQCLCDVKPSDGISGLTACVEEKLNL